jgi:hypothetical protein
LPSVTAAATQIGHGELRREFVQLEKPNRRVWEVTVEVREYGDQHHLSRLISSAAGNLAASTGLPSVLENSQTPAAGLVSDVGSPKQRVGIHVNPILSPLRRAPVFSP